MAYQVTVQYPNGQQLTFKFEKDTVYFGRNEGNDIRLAHSYVSGRHFMIQQQRGGFFVQDVGSTNGTLVNGQPLEPQTPQPLHLGDVIQVGPLEIRLEPIVEATIIEKVPSQAVRRPDIPPPAPPTVYQEVPEDQPSPMWKIQTGMFRAQGDVVRVSDQAVPAPRGDEVAAVERPGFEESLRRPGGRTSTPITPVPPVISMEEVGSFVGQVLGAVVFAGALALMIAVLLL